MSKIVYRYRDYEINTGWEPFGGFFLLISDSRDDEDGTIFDNCWLENPQMTLEEVEIGLSALKIPFPQIIKRRLYEHGLNKLGNVFEFYELDPSLEDGAYEVAS